MRYLLAFALLVASLPALAAQDGTVTFSPPTSGGAPTGYRLYRDGTLVGPVTSGQTIPGLFPNDTGTYVIGVEALNTAGAGTRVNRTVVLGPPPVQPPGPVINLTINAPCATSNPPTCTIVVTQTP
jgi:hypothetical protein